MCLQLCVGWQLGNKTESKRGPVKELKNPQVTKSAREAAAELHMKQLKKVRAAALATAAGISKKKRSGKKPNKTPAKRLKDGKGRAVQLEFSSEEEDPEPKELPQEVESGSESE